MKTKILLAFFLLTAAFPADSQTKTVPLEIPSPVEKIAHSLYHSILLSDIRSDTSNFGFVQKGFFNRRTKVRAEIPLKVQLSRMISSLTDRTAQNGQLLLLLRQCSYAEVTNMSNEKGYFHFRAILFSHDDEQYKEIAAIDTVAMVKALDVTQKMLRSGYRIITAFIAENLKQEPTGNLVLSGSQLPFIDSIEKSKLPLYVTHPLIDGIYYNFSSFVHQRPDETKISTSFNQNGELRRVNYVDKEGRKKRAKSKLIYAVVYKGKSYIATKYGYYPLQKKANDFYFIGKANDHTTADLVTAEIFFGVIGGLLAQSATSTFEMKLDHLSGGFIRIRAVNENTAQSTH